MSRDLPRAGGDRRETLRQRRAAGIWSGAGVLLVLALFGLVNYFGWKYHLRGDWTSQRIYTLSERSGEILAGSTEPVEIVVFMRPQDELYEPVRELVDRYAAASSRIRVRTVDPERNLAQARALVDDYGLSRGNVLVVRSGGEQRVLDAAELAEYDYSGLQIGQGPRMSGFRGEQAISSALLALSEGEKPRVRFTTGHGELRLDDSGQGGLQQFATLIGQDNVELEEWRTLGSPAVPADTDLLVIAGPQTAFTPPELAALSAYLDGGGRLLVLLEPRLSAALAVDPLEEWLAAQGIELARDVVVDPDRQVPFYGGETFFVADFADHPVTRALRDAGIPVLVSLARSVGVAADAEPERWQVLARTSADGWGETGLERLDAVERDGEDLAGPVGLAVLSADVTAAESTGQEAEHRPRLAVVGDADFMANALIGSAGNAAFGKNLLHWMLERPQLLEIEPKRPEQVRLELTRGQIRRIFWMVFALLPLSAVGAGLAVLARRRRVLP